MGKILAKVLDATRKLPPLLAYGILALIAIGVLVAVNKQQGEREPSGLLILLAFVFFVAIVAFVYLDAKHRTRVRPVKEVFAEIQRELNRKTFNEPLQECVDQKWIDRFRGACETYVLLARHQESVEAGGSDSHNALYHQLLKEVDGYRMDLATFLLEQKHFEQGRDGKLKIPSSIAGPCEEHRKSIEALGKTFSL